jgi:hypothetical protein
MRCGSCWRGTALLAHALLAHVQVVELPLGARAPPLRAGILLGGRRGRSSGVASRDGPGIQGQAAVRLAAWPPDWRVSAWRQQAWSLHKARSAKSTALPGWFELPIRTT